MFKLEISNTTNAAFTDDANGEFNPKARNIEIARILEEIAHDITEFDRDRGSCMDINGNRVGSWKISED